MTLEQLLDSSPEALEAMSYKELEAFFAPMLDVTRPERDSSKYKGEASSIRKRDGTKMNDKQMKFAGLSEEKQRAIMDALKDVGIDRI